MFTAMDSPPIPNEILQHVMQFLGARDLCSASTVDRRHRDSARDPSLWRRLCRIKKHPRAPRATHPKAWYRRMETPVPLRVHFLHGGARASPQGIVDCDHRKSTTVAVKRCSTLTQLRHTIALQTHSAPHLLRLWTLRDADRDECFRAVPLRDTNRRTPGVLARHGLPDGGTLLCYCVFATYPGHEYGEHIEQLCARSLFRLPPPTTPTAILDVNLDGAT